jgi:hypothetical protein
MLNGVFGMKHPFDVAQGKLLRPYSRNAVGIPSTSLRTSLQEDLLRNKKFMLVDGRRDSFGFAQDKPSLRRLRSE